MLIKLAEILEQKHISRYRLAKMTGIHNQDIYAIIKGKKPLYDGWKKKIAEALEISESELLEEDPGAEEN